MAWRIPPSWRLVWCSEAVSYGGGGTPVTLAVCHAEWSLPGGVAALFAPGPVQKVEEKVEDAMTDRAPGGTEGSS